ncbi:MAG: pilus assembly protein N-terminal domain-containing protein [Pseudomonadota bacterium]
MTSFFKPLALIAATVLFAGAALAEQFVVEGGKAKPLRLPGDAANVSLGNQNIAEVAVIDRDLLLISGKSFGTTNLIVFDNEGSIIHSGDIVVTSETANLVTINRAGSDFTYNCSPECRRTLQLGDNSAHLGELVEQLELLKELNE